MINRLHLTIFTIVVVVLAAVAIGRNINSDSTGQVYCLGWVDGYRQMAEYVYGPAPADFNEQAFQICLNLRPWES